MAARTDIIKEISRDKTRRAYNRLMATLGRAPTYAEMGRALGVSRYSATKLMTHYALERYVMTRQETGRATKERGRAGKARRAISEEEMECRLAEQEAERAERARLRRAKKLRKTAQAAATESAARKWQRVGSEYPRDAYIPATCSCCRRPMMLRPWEWPLFRRGKDGRVLWVCSNACDRALAMGEEGGGAYDW